MKSLVYCCFIGFTQIIKSIMSKTLIRLIPKSSSKPRKLLLASIRWLIMKIIGL